MDLTVTDVLNYYSEILALKKRVSKRQLLSMFAAFSHMSLTEKQRIVEGLRPNHRRVYLDYFRTNFIDSVANFMRSE